MLFAIGALGLYFVGNTRELKQFKKLPRAEMQVGESSLNFRPANRLEVSMLLTNRGTLTASQVEIKGNIIIRLPSDLPIDLSKTPWQSSDIPHQFSPNASVRALFLIDVLQGVTKLGIERGWYQLLFFGVLHYVDEANQSHKTLICLRFQKDQDRLILAEKKYWPLDVETFSKSFAE